MQILASRAAFQLGGLKEVFQRSFHEVITDRQIARDYCKGSQRRRKKKSKETTQIFT